MAINNKQKDKMRRVIRLSMIALALLLLFWAVVLPIINNGVALGIENDLKEVGSITLEVGEVSGIIPMYERYAIFWRGFGEE